MCVNSWCSAPGVCAFHTVPLCKRPIARYHTTVSFDRVIGANLGPRFIPTGTKSLENTSAFQTRPYSRSEMILVYNRNWRISQEFVVRYYFLLPRTSSTPSTR